MTQAYRERVFPLMLVVDRLKGGFYDAVNIFGGTP